MSSGSSCRPSPPPPSPSSSSSPPLSSSARVVTTRVCEIAVVIVIVSTPGCLFGFHALLVNFTLFTYTHTLTHTRTLSLNTNQVTSHCYTVYRSSSIVYGGVARLASPSSILSSANRAGTNNAGSASYGHDSRTMLRTSYGIGDGEMVSGSNDSIKCLICCNDSRGNERNMLAGVLKI
jgi:hypothetical protein